MKKIATRRMASVEVTFIRSLSSGYRPDRILSGMRISRAQRHGTFRESDRLLQEYGRQGGTECDGYEEVKGI